MNIPKWVWFVIVVVVLLIVLVLLKVDFTGHVGKSGIGFGVTQDLVH